RGHAEPVAGRVGNEAAEILDCEHRVTREIVVDDRRTGCARGAFEFCADGVEGNNVLLAAQQAAAVEQADAGRAGRNIALENIRGAAVDFYARSQSDDGSRRVVAGDLGASRGALLEGISDANAGAGWAERDVVV